MNKKTLKRQRDLKTKLTAAICMLLVSSLMMVTTTYAWFTLSTAPEVTGITTAVGANGNLEMALLSPAVQENGAFKSKWDEEIKSDTSDSMDAAGQLISEANITWGNLVDLSDNNTYGLNNISLYPSEIAITEDGKLGQFPLSRPVYGADGRVAELKADTLASSYSSGTFSNEGAFGVRAVGTASSMTARELAHRSALTSAASASTAAKSAASGTLMSNGNVLAGMAITHVGDDTATFSYSQVNTLREVVKDLQTAHEHIETAMKWYIVAENIAPATVTDATYLEIQNAITTMELSALKESSYKMPDGFQDEGEQKGAYSTLLDSQQKVSTALSTLDTLLNKDGAENRTDIAWGEFSTALTSIMDYNSMLLCDVPMSQVKEKNDDGSYKNASKIVKAMSDGGLRLQMRTGSGVFADIADFCGTYTASIIFPENTVVMGVDLSGWEATMTTDGPINPTWLTKIRSEIEPFASGDNSTSAKSITDFYGYIIDLAFRTNASDSSLLLQADAIDRIYGDDGKNEETLGGGSTMTFTGVATDSETFGITRVQALMTNLRIVFFETDTKDIIGEARLNPDSVVIEGNSVTMKMGMYEGTGFKTGDDANVIADLAQNTAKAISVLVYLDGTSISNADVASTGSQSMTGSMNLQFASSAELVPMNYADLKDGKSTADGTVQTITMKNVAADAATSGNNITVASAVATSGTGFAVVLNGTVPEGSKVVATVAGQQIDGVETAVSGVVGYRFAYTGELKEDTEISIAVVANTNADSGDETE